MGRYARKGFPRSLVPSDPLQSRLEVDVRTVALGLDRLAVVEEHGVRIPVFSSRRVRWLTDPAAAVDQNFLEALLLGSHRIVVPQVPLAKYPGRVSGLFQDFCQCFFLWVQHGPP